MIIDCHTHIDNYHDEAEDASRARFDLLENEMRRNRVDMALVLTSYKVQPGRPSTHIAVELTRDLKTVFVVAGISFEAWSPTTSSS